MKYQIVKISLGKRIDDNCNCIVPVNQLMEWFRVMPYTTTESSNEAYQKAAEYNDRRKCGCKVEVREIQ